MFIGSSSAALPLARQIGEEVAKGDEVEVKVWDEGILQAGAMLLDGLLDFANLFDFAVLVGGLGRRRALPIVAYGKSGDLKLPSDLDGLLTIRLGGDKPGDASDLAKEIGKLREEIKKRAKEARLSLLPSTGLAFGYFHNFLTPVNNRLAELKSFDPIAIAKLRAGEIAREIEGGPAIPPVLRLCTTPSSTQACFSRPDSGRCCRRLNGKASPKDPLELVEAQENYRAVFESGAEANAQHKTIAVTAVTDWLAPQRGGR